MQQAVRSGDHVRLYPVACGDKKSIGRYEHLVADIVGALYDNGVAYSLRDGDGAVAALEHRPPVFRFRLNCYSAENLLLTTEVLNGANTTWPAVQRRIEDWVRENRQHPRYEDVVRFVNTDFDRQNAKVKSVRNLVVAQFIGSTKPWEVLVGQSIAKLNVDAGQRGPNGLVKYLGAELCETLLRR